MDPFQFVVGLVAVIVMGSPIARALASRLERASGDRPDDLLVQRLNSLEGEVERLSSEVKRLEDEGQFMSRLLESREAPPALPTVDRAD